MAESVSYSTRNEQYYGRAYDDSIFRLGDTAAPAAVAAVHARSTIEEDGQTVLTIIDRSAGSTL